MTTAVAGQIEIEHFHRYFLARQLSRGLDVLDLASGEGYGTSLIAQVARTAVGVDLSKEAVEHSLKNYRSENLKYLQGSAGQIPAPNHSFDLVVSLETIEHVEDQASFLAEIKRVLRKEGRLMISSPNRDIYSPPNSSANPFHVHELSELELSKLLARFFCYTQVLHQRPLIGSALVSENHAAAVLTFEQRGATHFEASDGLPRSAYIISVASDSQVDLVPHSIYIQSDEVGATLAREPALEALKAETEEARRQAENFKQMAEAAETGRDKIRIEMAKCIEQAELQRSSYIGQISIASEQLEKFDRLLREAYEAVGRERELKEATLAKEREQAESGFQQERMRSEADFARLTAEQDARFETINKKISRALMQRDLARSALKRAVAATDKSWRIRFQNLESLLANSDRRGNEMEQIAKQWRSHYDLLARRVQDFTKAAWIKPVRKILWRKLLPGTRL